MRIRPIFKSFPDWESAYDCTLIQSLITMRACTRMHMYVGVWVHTCMKRTKLLILEHFRERYNSFEFQTGWRQISKIQILWSQVSITSNLLTHTFTVRYHYSVPTQAIPTLHSKFQFINHYQYFHTILVKTCREVMN